MGYEFVSDNIGTGTYRLGTETFEVNDEVAAYQVAQMEVLNKIEQNTAKLQNIDDAINGLKKDNIGDQISY
jgi:hypothetical protein